MKRVRNVFTLIVIAVFSFGYARQAEAQSGTAVKDIRVSYQFGKEIIFDARIESSIPIQKAVISIRDQSGTFTRAEPLLIGNNGQTEFRLDAGQNIVPPFAKIFFSYQILLNDGQTFNSEEQFIDYIDNRFGEWKSLNAGAINVHWYNGDDAFGQSAMSAAQSSMQAIGNLMPVDASRPIDIYIYASPDDLQGALYLRGESWEAGHASPALDVILAAVPPGPSQSLEMEQRIPHELAHVLLYRKAGERYKTLPAWLREGFATLSELNPSPDYDRVLMTASQNNTLIPIKDLCASFPADSGDAFLAYAESRSFTRYLRDTYGSSSLLALADQYLDGLDCDSGATRALGVSLAQLDVHWREVVLGQNVAGAVLRDMAPYLILLGLILIGPLWAALKFLRRKANDHGPETYAK